MRDVVFVLITDLGEDWTPALLRNIVSMINPGANNVLPLLIAVDEWAGYESGVSHVPILDTLGRTLRIGWWNRHTIESTIAEWEEKFASTARILKRFGGTAVRLPFLADAGKVLRKSASKASTAQSI
jgi:hypothetical protein